MPCPGVGHSVAVATHSHLGLPVFLGFRKQSHFIQPTSTTSPSTWPRSASSIRLPPCDWTSPPLAYAFSVWAAVCMAQPQHNPLDQHSVQSAYPTQKYPYQALASHTKLPGYLRGSSLSAGLHCVLVYWPSRGLFTSCELTTLAWPKCPYFVWTLITHTRPSSCLGALLGAHLHPIRDVLLTSFATPDTLAPKVCGLWYISILMPR